MTTSVLFKVPLILIRVLPEEYVLENCSYCTEKVETVKHRDRQIVLSHVGRETDRETERQTETERQRDRDRKTQRDKETERQRERRGQTH